MGTTYARVSSGTSPGVVLLRPRALARRASVQEARLVARRRRVAPGHQRPLEIVADVLARAGAVADRDLDAWERLLDMVEEQESPHTIPACAATANLVGLAVFGDPADHEALADLADAIGHTRLARLQHRHLPAIEQHAGLPLTTRAIRRLVERDLAARLAIDPDTADRAERIDNASLRAAHALLVQGIDRTWKVPVLDSPEELVDIVTRGTVVEWRHHFAMLLRDPWSPYTARVVDLARQAGRSHAASVIAAFVDLCREEAAEPGRTLLAREIGGLMTTG